MHLSTLQEWLDWISCIHISEIELGLDRVKTVAARLDLLSPECPVIIVGGTNGKGSTVAGLDAIYQAAGFKVGTFTSPILFKHNEYVRINGEEVDDAAFCSAYAKIEAIRGDISLTPFEFHTLAALWIFKQIPLDVIILEVGLGGRLDAVNIMDADVSIVTSIGIDHVDWLGATRETIGREKAGIYRTRRPAICGDSNPPQTLIDYAMQIDAPFYRQSRDFTFQKNKNEWSWFHENVQYKNLPVNALATENMATVLMAVSVLKKKLNVPLSAITIGLQKIKLLGRIQVIPGSITEIFDVAHNPDAVSFLANRSKEFHCTGKTYAVFSMLADKDILGSIKNISDIIDEWYVAPIASKRGATAEELFDIFQRANIPVKNQKHFRAIKDAYRAAKANAKHNDRIIIFGSFSTVAQILG